MDVFWAYCRVSTTKEEQEESLETQAAWAEQFAREHRAQVTIVREQASAKTTVGRPRFNAMMADLAGLPKTQRPKYLLVAALDRLSRSTRDTLNVIEALRELKITLYQRGLGPVTADEFPRLAALVGMSLAGEAENYGRSVRMRQSWEKRRAEGKPTSNKVPYGLQLRGGHDIVIPDSGAWVLRAFQWYASGELGMFSIAKRFAEGAPNHTWLTSKIDENGERVAKTRKPTKWESNRIRKMLELRRYRGTAVPADLFDRVQQRLAKTPKTGSRRIREYPLSGAMSCDTCGRHLHGAASGGYAQKTLPDRTVVRTLCAERRTRYYACLVCRYRVNAVAIEASFFETVGELYTDEATLRRWVDARVGGSAKVTSLRKELAVLERDAADGEEARRLDRAFDLALAGGMEPEQLRRQLERVKAEFTAQRERAAALRHELYSVVDGQRTIDGARRLLADFHRLYNRATYEEKRQLLVSIAEALGGLKVGAQGLRWPRRPAHERVPPYLT